MASWSMPKNFPSCITGFQVSIVCRLLLVSNIACESCHAWMLDVQVTSVSPSQKPIVSPHHCGVFCTCDCLPTITWRRKLSAIPEMNWMFQVDIVSWKSPARDGWDHQRMNPSGQQNDALHCGAFVTASW